jgi:hypothetical protein
MSSRHARGQPADEPITGDPVEQIAFDRELCAPVRVMIPAMKQTAIRIKLAMIWRNCIASGICAVTGDSSVTTIARLSASSRMLT